MLACFYLFISFLFFITNALPDTIFLGHIWVFVTNCTKKHHDYYTLYDLANIQNKAQKAWEQFEKRQWRKFRFRQKKFRLQYRNLILVSVDDTETRFRSYTNVLCIKAHLEISIAGHHLPAFKELFSKKLVVWSQFVNEFMHRTIHRFVHVESTFHGLWVPFFKESTLILELSWLLFPPKM